MSTTQVLLLDELMAAAEECCVDFEPAVEKTVSILCPIDDEDEEDDERSGSRGGGLASAFSGHPTAAAAADSGDGELR